MSIVNRPIDKSQLETLSASLGAGSSLHLDIRAVELGIASPEAHARVDEACRAHASRPAPLPKVWVATASMHDHVQLTSAGAGLACASYRTRSGAYARSSALPWSDAEEWLRSEGVVVTSNWALLARREES